MWWRIICVDRMSKAVSDYYGRQVHDMWQRIICMDRATYVHDCTLREKLGNKDSALLPSFF